MTSQAIPASTALDQRLGNIGLGIGRIVAGLLFVLCGSILMACAAPTATPTVGTVEEQLARGAPLYAQNCATASCHGTKGEGIRAGDSFSAFPLVGKEFSARNPNAQVVFDVVRSGEEANLRALTDQQIYDAIAFEFSQNNVRLTVPLTGRNSTMTPSGNVSFNPAAIYPPLDNVTYIVPTIPPRAFYFASNDYVAMQVDQIAQASLIGSASPRDGGAFVLIVFAMQDLTSHLLDIDPKFMRLYDSQGNAAEPQSIAFATPIERFHPITISPSHGTAAIAVFSLAANSSPDKLVYDDSTGHALTLSLR